MTTQQGMGRIKQLFKQMDSAARLKACREELDKSLEIFRVSVAHELRVLFLTDFQVQTGRAVTSQMVQMQQDARRQHEELLALLATHPELTNSGRSSVRRRDHPVDYSSLIYMTR